MYIPSAFDNKYPLKIIKYAKLYIFACSNHHARDTEPMPVSCWASVVDDGPTWNGLCLNISRWVAGVIERGYRGGLCVGVNLGAVRLYYEVTWGHIVREIRWLRDGIAPQQGQCVSPMLIQCWANVVDGGSTLDQHRADILCRMGMRAGEFPWFYLMAHIPTHPCMLPLIALTCLCMNHRDKKFFRFEIIINVFVISFWLIWIPMVWV